MAETPLLTEAVENYLKALYDLQQAASPVSTSALAERMGVAPASVTAMMKKLSSESPTLVKYISHRGAVLTDLGRKKALEVIRHHRLIELYLHQQLGYSWDEVHDEAEKLEHFISETFEERIAELLGDPQFDPHGDPIPTKDGRLPKINLVPLSNAKERQVVRVARVADQDADLLRYLEGLGIKPNVTLRIVEKSPFDGPLYVVLAEEPDGERHGLGKSVTDNIDVEILPAAGAAGAS